MNNTQIVTTAFDNWMAGRGYISAIFADDMTWEIVGRSAAAGHFANAQEFTDKVLAPFGQRFSTDDPFRPIAIRGVFTDATAFFDSIAFDELWTDVPPAA